MTEPESPETAADGTAPVAAADAVVDPPGPGRAVPARPTWRAAGLWVLLIGVAAALDGLVGGLALVFVAAVLLAGFSTRVIGGVGVALLVLAPVAFMVRGVPTSSGISPTIVTRSLLPHHLVFAGLVLVGAYAVIDLAPHLKAWAASERPAQDDGPPLGVAGGALVVAVIAVGAVLACRAVLGA